MSTHPVLELIRWTTDLVRSLSADRVSDLLKHAPEYYLQWWQKLYSETPEHVFIETALIIFIFWLLFIRKTIDPKKSSKKSKLTDEEINWLIETWQPDPLVPALTNTEQKILDNYVVS